MNSLSLYKHALIVILGHYGSGKTNLALNMARQMKQAGRDPLLIDLDVVNPYFRSSDYGKLMQAEGIRLLGPIFGNSNVDAPSLAPGIDSGILKASFEQPVVLDVGGDPDGARALARYAPSIKHVDDSLIVMLVNLKRPESQDTHNTLQMIQEIEATASLKVGALVGNTHLAEFTTAQTIEASLAPLKELSARSGLPLQAITVPEHLVDELKLTLSNDLDAFSCELVPIERLVKTVWQ